jgi:hypothetical protein
MNIFDMHIGVNIGVQKLASNVNADLLDEEIDYYLNNSINEFIKQQYSLIKNTERGIPNQYVHENLRKLLSTEKIAADKWTTSTKFPKAQEAALPEAYKYFISGFCTIDTTTTKNVVLLQPQVLQKYIKTETNDPIFRQLPLYLEDDKFILFGVEKTTEPLAGQVVLTVTYIKNFTPVKLGRVNGSYNPATSSNPTFLPDHTHKEIVDMTIKEILKDLTQFKGQE